MRAVPIILALIVAFLLAACLPSPQPETRRETIFTVACSITLYDGASERAFQEAFEALRRIDADYSMWRTGSALDMLNSAAGSGPTQASPELIAILQRGLELARLTEGRYDPTVGPLVKLWGIGTKGERVPPPEEIRAALGLVGWRELKIDAEVGWVELAKPGMILDFGSLAKGEGAVVAGKLLAAQGLRSAIVDIGGSILTLGSRPEGRPWRVGIQSPGSPRGSLLGYVEVRDAVVNTSGIYERWFESQGKRWNHIVDTRTGYPLDNGLLSATVIRGREESADGPSLALLVLGAKEGIALAEKLGLAAILVDERGGVHLSTRAKPLFTLTDPAYRLEAP